MPLSVGTRLGPYEIVSPLGAGGMGEVYRARDARLERDVAIKVLPADVAGDADRRARFERGQRFLFIARQDEAMPRTINVVLDWPALVEAPAGAPKRE